ncbi:stAR-related lipid transfer protein 3-like [Amphibalanus amphitrite]|uniref:stAR-related lipid transfer protein 3-like n=1 Tax=Amphibalanus amphitrite TaxID=1232801 RepID=UPI001C91B847|nr:stAR-related lipid transfer protein 3-like [Amphibalanus amphitrite]
MSADDTTSSQKVDTASVGTSSINARDVSGSTANLVHSSNSVPTDYDYGEWITGMEMEGRISPARRFFCLLVTFDVLLCCIFWLVCVVLSGKNVFAELEDQVVHYSVETSLFDVVSAAFIRFMLLIVVYVIIRMDHWWMIALTTAASCIATLFKILYYQWQSASASNTFQVTLIVSFFILAWLEVWLYDHRVIPQETRARLMLQRRAGYTNQRTPLVGHQHQHVRDYLSTCTGSVSNFYSPMGSPQGSDDEDEEGAGPRSRLSEEDRALRQQAEENCRRALDLLNSSDWKQEEEFDDDDILFSRRVGSHTLFMFTCTVACPTETFANELIHNCDHCPEWNGSLTSCRQLQRIDGQCEVRYQQTGPFLGGMVSPRDFINLRLAGRKGLMFFSSVVSIAHRDDPRPSDMVRAVNRPTIITIRPCVRRPRHCVVEWLMNFDCRVGMVPRRMTDRGTRQAARNLHSYLRQLGRRLAAAEV